MSDQDSKAENNPSLAGEAQGIYYEDIQARPKNWLVPVVLLRLKESTTYGYELMHRTARLGFEAIHPGSLYRTLRKMEQDGLCKSEWDVASAGPARRMYSLSEAGEAYLDSWVQSLQQYQSAMDAFFRAYSGSGRSGPEESGSETHISA